MDDLMYAFFEKKQVEAIKKTNEYVEKFGLCLTDQEVQMLIVNRKESLMEQQRVEFGEGIVEKLIYAFCDSNYIYQGNYVETIVRLQDIFYIYKNEAMDEVSDVELLEIMREAFDGECQGSLEYLEETYLEKFARNIRANTRHFLGRYKRTDEKM